MTLDEDALRNPGILNLAFDHLLPVVSKVKEDLDSINMLVGTKLYQSSVFEKAKEALIDLQTPVLLYGPQSVGKSYAVKRLFKPMLER